MLGPDMTSVALEQPTAPAVRARHFVLAVLALAMGGFAIGTTEFVTMGLLPEIADGVGVSIPAAGHMISAYAVGVVVGAPVLAYFGARYPRRGLLLVLVAWLGVGNAMSAVAGSYGLLTAGPVLRRAAARCLLRCRLAGGGRLAALERRGRAVAMVMLGLAVANVVGVPGGDVAGPAPGLALGVLGVAGIGAGDHAAGRVLRAGLPGRPEATGRRELSAFRRPQVWLTLLAGAVGFGGMFAVYSYIAPTITEVGGLARVGGAVCSCWRSAWAWSRAPGWPVSSPTGRCSARCSIGASAWPWCCCCSASPRRYGWPSLPVVFLITVLGSVLVVNLQLRLMDVAGDAQTLGAAMNHASLNVANALGAWLGGLVIAAGYGYARRRSWAAACRRWASGYCSCPPGFTSGRPPPSERSRGSSGVGHPHLVAHLVEGGVGDRLARSLAWRSALRRTTGRPRSRGVARAAGRSRC